MTKTETALRNLVPRARVAGLDVSEATAVLLELDAYAAKRIGPKGTVPSGYHFMTNFSRDMLHVYQAAIAEYNDRKHKFYICTHATYGADRTYDGGMALYARTDGDTGDFWSLFDRIKAREGYRYDWER